MAVLNNTGILAGASGVVVDPGEPLEVEKSLRFNKPDSANMIRTVSSDGNRKTWTWSSWVKRAKLSDPNYNFFLGCFAGNNNNGYATIGFKDNDSLLWSSYSSNFFETEQKFRDPSAWMHVVISVDTTISAPNEDNRIRLYVNGSEVTEFSTRNNPSLSQDLAINMAGVHYIGSSGNGMFDGYLADIHLVEGLQLDASSFGMTDATTGQWIPKKYTGTYGTNGFHLAMDPAETGTVWSTAGTVSNINTTGSDGAIAGLFNGSRSTSSTSNYMQTNAGNNTTGTYTFPGSGIPFTTCEIAAVKWGDVIKANGVDISSLLSQTWADPAWVDITNSISSPLTSVSAARNTTSSSAIFGIKIDGKIIVDHTAIGYDSSGEKNHWHENNLWSEAGITWSDYWTAGSTHITPNQFGAGPTKLFDGGTGFGHALSTTNSVDGTYMEFDFTGLPGGGIPFNTIEYNFERNGATNMILTFNNVSQDYATNSGGWNWGYVYKADGTTLMDPGLLTNIKVDKNGDTGASYFTGVKIDGTILVDGVVPAFVDLLADVPGTPYDNSLNGGANYCTLNPLHGSSYWTLSDGNLTGSYNQSNSQYPAVAGTIGVSSGKWYFEVEYTSSSGQGYGLGVCNSSCEVTSTVTCHKPGFWGAVGRSGSWSEYSLNGTNSTSTLLTIADGDIFGVKLDLDNNTIYITKNGSALYTLTTSLPADTYFPLIQHGSAPAPGDFNVNFGQRTFDNLPTGYKALNTYNLDAPLIDDPSKHFDVATDTGASILSAATGLTDGADFVWIKDRANIDDHILFNRINDTGMDGTPHLRSNENDDESTCGTYSAPSGNSVAWVWNAGTTTDPSNNAGSITSSVRANTTAGFSIVTWTNGNNTSPTTNTLGHGLGVVPDLVFVKSTSGSYDWAVKSEAFSNPVRDELYLHLPNAIATAGVDLYYRDSSKLGFRETSIGGNGASMLALCWSEVEGYSKFGSYEGGSAPFVFTGFRPRWIMIKNADSSSEEWTIFDTARDPHNLAGSVLYANTAGQEYDGSSGTYARNIDFLSNGFKINTGNPINQSGTHIYCAWAESPFKYSNAR